MIPIRTHVQNFDEVRRSLEDLFQQLQYGAVADITALQSAVVAAQGNITTLQDIVNSYGELLVTTGSAQSLTGGAAAVKCTQFDTETPASGSVTPAHANDKITIATSGIYEIWFELRATLSGSSAMTAQVFRNGSLNSPRLQDTTIVNGTDVRLSARGYVLVALNDYYELFIATSNSVDVTLANNGVNRFGVRRIK